MDITKYEFSARRTLAQERASLSAFQSQISIVKWECEPAARSNERNLNLSPDLTSPLLSRKDHSQTYLAYQTTLPVSPFRLRSAVVSCAISISIVFSDIRRVLTRRLVFF